ncbi:TPA: conjugal transfer protein TraL [Neisseria oralis]
MKEVNLVVQSKGGCGKTFCCASYAQYVAARAANQVEVHCYDTDTSNRTLSRYKPLNVQIVNILTGHNTVDTRNFDGLIEQFLEKDGIGIVDTGSNTFIPLMSYIAENNITELLRESDVRLILHVPIEGGQAQTDCIESLGRILMSVDAEVVVWLNEFHGAIENNGKSFEQFSIYQKYKDRIVGVVRLEKLNPDTYGKDIELMTKLHLTFDEVQTAAEMTLMPKQRLRNVRRAIFGKLESLPILVNQGSEDGQE